MSTHTQEPLKKARLISLSVAWCFATIASCIGLAALVRSNQDKSNLKKLAPAPTVVKIDTNDITHAGISATTASLVISVLIFNFIAGSLLPRTKALFRRTLRIQAALLVTASAWLLGTMIAVMIFYMNRHAKVTAFIGDKQLPDSVIKGVEAASGKTGVYKKLDYLTLLAIFPWLSLFFTLIAAAILFKAGGAVSKHVTTHRTSTDGTASPSTTVKEDVSHNEKADV